jgi:IK cytokine
LRNYLQVLDGLHILLIFYGFYNAGKSNLAIGDYDEAVKPSKTNGSALKQQSEKNMPPPPPPPPRDNDSDGKEKQSRADDDDIFVGDGVDYSVPNKEMSQSPVSEDMEESPRNHQKQSYFIEPMYGPVPPSEPAQAWQQPVSLCSVTLVLTDACIN